LALSGGQLALSSILEVIVQPDPFRPVAKFDEIVTRGPTVAQGAIFVAPNLMTRHVVVTEAHQGFLHHQVATPLHLILRSAD
jgi:hypothetical protein